MGGWIGGDWMDREWMSGWGGMGGWIGGWLTR